MNLSVKQEQNHRHREQTGDCQGERVGERVGEGQSGWWGVAGRSHYKQKG